MPTDLPPVGLVAHLHEHPVEDTNFQGVVVHAMPGDFTAWGANADAALQNFDKMLVSMSELLGAMADAWKASLCADFAEFRETLPKVRPPDRKPGKVYVRTAGGVAYLLVQADGNAQATPTGEFTTCG